MSSRRFGTSSRRATGSPRWDGTSSTQVALGALTSTGQKKIQKSLRELCGILKILRGELAKVVNVTKTGDINKPVGDPPTLSRRCRVSMFNK